ncbi:hypothetical protein ANN_10033 [Periplaneta americana]|uniref:Uncharacterized protein n=1 Tax=Periplaneta americana TaxID=6978 RepID=A0ABQ8TQ90_PERAM|nr:hypothetical protein ANN_10033 [Periplaneta americana]
MWLSGFRKSHPSLSLRKSKAKSLPRAPSFNREHVYEFFTDLKDVMNRFNFPPNEIFNLDETGNSTVHVPPTIFSPKGLKQVSSMTSGERGINVTEIVAVNTRGPRLVATSESGEVGKRGDNLVTSVCILQTSDNTEYHQYENIISSQFVFNNGATKINSTAWPSNTQ